MEQNNEPNPLSDFDYGDDAAPEITNEVFAKLEELLRQLRDEQRLVNELEDRIAKSKRLVEDLSSRQIPDLMASVGQTTLRTTSGMQVTVVSKIRHSLPKERKPLGLDWLEQHGHGDIVKRRVEMQFTRGEEKLATEAVEALRERYGNRAQLERDVASATLGSLINKLLQEGKEIPVDVFGIYEQKSTVIE